MNFSKRLVIILMLGLGLSYSCKKETTVIESVTQRKLVIITDDDAGTDIMITILGAVRTNHPDVETEFIQSKPFDIYEGAFLADAAVKHYPSGTYFAIIVEPGVVDKRMICDVNGRKIVAPDNGVLSRVFYTAGITEPKAYHIENPAVLGGAPWQSLSFEEFYSRAIVAMLSSGNIEDFGPECSPVTYPIQPPALNGDTVTGEILFADNFGNCICDITPGLMTGFQLTDTLFVKAGTSSFAITYGTAYGSVPLGQNVCFINSSKRLEMAINYGNLSQTYNIGAGDKVKLWR